MAGCTPSPPLKVCVANPKVPSVHPSPGTQWVVVWCVCVCVCVCMVVCVCVCVCVVVCGG